MVKRVIYRTLMLQRNIKDAEQMLQKCIRFSECFISASMLLEMWFKKTIVFELDFFSPHENLVQGKRLYGGRRGGGNWKSSRINHVFHFDRK